MPCGRRASAGSPCWWRARPTGPQVGGLSQKRSVKSNACGSRTSRKSLPYKDFRLEVEALEVGAKGVGQVRAGERELHRGLEKAQLLARVVAAPFELDGVDGTAAAKGSQPVGQLDFAPGVGRGLGQDREEVGREHVTADDGQV